MNSFVIGLMTSREVVYYADISESLTGIQNSAASSFQLWGNIGLGILILLYGGASFLGMEIKQTAKKWLLGGFVGAIVVVNYSTILDLLWSAIGG
ncbi:hypothetical protein [Enterococcus casseliflavus]|uniref:hypothetical protein n=1 Tax=Enterococcus casseliflavus TaxID=37734 RepID=UPI0034D30422